MRGTPTPIPRDAERGSMSVLIISLLALLLLVVSVIIAITSIYIEHKRLQDLADQTAISVAQQVQRLDRSGDGGVQLDDAQVAGLSADFLASSGAAASLPGLRLASPTGASSPDTAQVTLSAQAKIPLLSSILPVSVPITATGSAQTELGR